MRATSSRSTAPPARSTSARSRSSPRRSCVLSRGRSTPPAQKPTTSSAPSTASCSTPTRCRRLGVRANADTPEDAARARRFGAQGIGLCRTEHMFLGDRKQFVDRLVLARRRRRAAAGLRRAAAPAAAGLHGAARGDGRSAGDDPAARPAAARVPARPHRARRSRWRWRTRAAQSTPSTTGLLEAVRRMHEQNPMLGLRGVRLGLVLPGLFALQVRAIAEAVADRIDGRRRPAAGDHGPAGGRPCRSWRRSRREAAQVIAEVAAQRGVRRRSRSAR